MSASAPIPLLPRPDWIRARAPQGPGYERLKGLMRGLELHTVCEEAHCPNLGECWSRGTATFMILGDVCTRACGFCAVKTGLPAAPPDLDEARRGGEAVAPRHDGPHDRGGGADAKDHKLPGNHAGGPPHEIRHRDQACGDGEPEAEEADHEEAGQDRALRERLARDSLQPRTLTGDRLGQVVRHLRAPDLPHDRVVHGEAQERPSGRSLGGDMGHVVVAEREGQRRPDLRKPAGVLAS